MSRLRLLVVVAFVPAALVLPGSSAATIVPQHSIAGVKLGMTEARVKAKLGPPLRVRSGSNQFGPWRRLVYKRVTVFFQSGNKVTSLTTRGALERTIRGVGVGSKLARLRARLEGETCRREFGIHHCWIGRWEPGRVITDFRLVKGRVSSVTIGYVLD